jgi:hypothetical protein
MDGYTGLARSRESAAQWFNGDPENKCDPRLDENSRRFLGAFDPPGLVENPVRGRAAVCSEPQL